MIPRNDPCEPAKPDALAGADPLPETNAASGGPRETCGGPPPAADAPFDTALIERLLPQLARIAKSSIARRWQSKVGASDIVQDTFIEAAQTLPAFTGSTLGEFNQWLKAILINNLHDTRRKFVDAKMRAVGRERSLDPSSSHSLPGHHPSPFKVAAKREFDRELQTAINALADQDQQIITRRYRQKQTYAEIGEALGMNEDTVRKRSKRILSTLQHRLAGFDSRAITRIS